MSKVFSSENFYHTTIPVQHSESVAATAHNKTPIQNAFYVYTTYSNGKQTWYFILYCQARCKKQWNWIKVVGLHTNRWGRNIMYVNPFKCPKIKTESHKTYDTEKWNAWDFTSAFICHHIFTKFIKLLWKCV